MRSPFLQRLTPLAGLAHQWNNGWAVLTSMPFAVLLLVFLLLACVLGAFLPQEGLVPWFTIQEQFGRWAPLLRSFGLFSVFKAPWFLTLEALLFLSIAVGSFRWLRPAYKSATLRVLLSAQHIQASQGGQGIATPWLNIPLPTKPTTQLLANVTHHLQQAGYGKLLIKQVANELRLYTQKAGWARFGPVIAHVGLLLILGSGLAGAFTGFMAREIALPGETFSLATADELLLNLPEPYWLGRIPQGWKIKVEAFTINYYPNAPTQAKQYTTHLSILDATGNKTLAKGFTAVNHPFYYQGTGFYQASFAPTGQLYLKVNGKPLLLSTQTRAAGRPMATLPTKQPNSRLLLFPFTKELDGVRVNHLQIFEQRNGKLLGLPTPITTTTTTPPPPSKNSPSSSPLTLLQGQTATLAGVHLHFKGLQYVTGLQIKRSPELPWMYTGFALVSLGCLLSLTPHRRLWLVLETTPHTLRVWKYSRTNKAKTSFQQELGYLKTLLTQTL